MLFQIDGTNKWSSEDKSITKTSVTNLSVSTNLFLPKIQRSNSHNGATQFKPTLENLKNKITLNQKGTKSKERKERKYLLKFLEEKRHRSLCVLVVVSTHSWDIDPMAGEIHRQAAKGLAV